MVSVTKLIDLLNKPALLGWANKIGLQGISLKDYSCKSKNKGIIKHKQVEDYITKGIDFPESYRFDKCIEGFEVIGCEVDVNNERIAGRIDLILKKNGYIYICDFKSNGGIYLSTKIQLSTYKHLYGADKICFINLHDFKIIEIQIETKHYFNLIGRLYQVNEILTKINERL